MSIRDRSLKQYQAKVAAAFQLWGRQTDPVPPEGWIATVRKAFGMSGAQLARRMGLSRARINQAERAELEGGITLKNMRAMAEAMGCQFVYAVVPRQPLSELLEAQARRKAAAVVSTASTHMALEDQALPDTWRQAEVERLTSELLRALPRDLWDEP